MLDNYKEEAPAWFWDLFPSNLKQLAVSMINADKLRAAALSCRFPDRRTLDLVKNWMQRRVPFPFCFN